MDQDKLIQWAGFIISIIALIVSLIALLYTVLTYLLKSGHRIRCNYTACSTRECDDDFISSLTLENLKDRATVIFNIYFKLGNNNYLEIENFENSPLILRPFEVYHKEYDPILLYSVGTDRIQIDQLLNNSKVKKSIILSTTDGKYLVKTNTKRWDINNLFFKNYFTAIIQPQRIYYKDKAYGSRIRFLLIFKYNNGSEQVVPLQNGDEQLKIFKNFQLTKESLSNKNKLEEYIKFQKDQNKIEFDELEVLSLTESIEEVRNKFKRNLIAEANSYFKYNFLGKLYTYKQNRKLDRENKKLRKRNKEIKTKDTTTYDSQG